MIIIIITNYRNHMKKENVLTYVVISEDKNVNEKEAEEILKYTDLTIEIRRMWDVKAKVITVKTGAAGSFSESFIQYLSNRPREHESDEIQTTAIFGTSHIVRKVL